MKRRNAEVNRRIALWSKQPPIWNKKTPSSKKVNLKEDSYIVIYILYTWGKRLYLLKKGLCLRNKCFPNTNTNAGKVVSAGVVFYFFMPLFFWCVSSYRSVVQYNSLIFFYCCFVELSFKLSSGSSPRPESPKDPGKQKKHTKTIHPGYSCSLFFVLSVFSKVLRCQGYFLQDEKHQTSKHITKKQK